MGKYIVENGKYTVFAKDISSVQKIISREKENIDEIKEKVESMIKKNGGAYKNLTENMSHTKLEILMYDINTDIFEEQKYATVKGLVKQRKRQENTFLYSLGYKYDGITKQRLDYILAHEINRLMLNPSTVEMQLSDEETKSRQVAGVIRKNEENGQYYGLQMQESVLNMLAELTVKNNKSADDIMKGKAESVFVNKHPQFDKLVRLIAISMRNDYLEEISFDKLLKLKLDSQILNVNGEQEPANTFFYFLVNDTSIIEKEFDKYLQEGAYKKFNLMLKNLDKVDYKDERYQIECERLEDIIVEFANNRMQEKYKLASQKNNKIPSLQGKIQYLKEARGIEKLEEEKKSENKEVSWFIKIKRRYDEKNRQNEVNEHAKNLPKTNKDSFKQNIVTSSKVKKKIYEKNIESNENKTWENKDNKTR